ncbi:MAG: trypsin-like peptidase domain-containing protein [Pirellulales bacterium]
MGWLRPSAACALFVCSSVIAGQARGEAILLDFQTDWCGACRIMEPVIQELAAEGHHVRKIDGDQQPELVRKYRIEGYPTFVALRDGREVGRLSGPGSKAQLLALLEKAGAATRTTAAGADENVPHTIRGQSPDSIANTRSNGGHRNIQPRSAVAASVGLQPDIVEGWEPTGAPPGALRQSKPISQERLAAASVRLRIQDKNGQSTGSGTIIDARDGEALILTCGHMFREFDNSGRIVVDFFGPAAPQQLTGTLVSYDLNSDVGLVRVTGDHRFVAAKVAPPAYTCRSGDAVVSVGCDNGAEATPRVTQIVSIDRYQHAPNLQVAFEPVQGRSGGGLFNREGELIGVCNAADAADKQGLFAALGAIYAELDRTKLSFVYRPNAASAGEGETQLAAVATIPTPPVAAAAKLSNEERALLEELRGAQGAEVICLVRALDDPQAKSRVFQINRASAAFWRELAGHSADDSGRKLTSLENRGDQPGATSRKTPTGGAPLAARTTSTLLNDGRSDRIWPPRQREP